MPAPGFTPYGASPAPLGGSLSLVVSEWEFALSSYPSPAFPRLLLRLLTCGAELGAVGLPSRVSGREYRLGAAELAFLREEVSRRLEAGEVEVVPDAFLIASCPLAAVPKERTKFRAIHDLRPVNNFVPKAFGTLAYSSLEDLFSWLRLHPGAFLWKVDLSYAFRHIRLSPFARRLAGFPLDGTLYSDLCLPFGSRVAPFTFNLLAEALHWVLEKCGVQMLLHYLDDFFGLTTSASEAQHAVDLFLHLASCLGVSVNRRKCEGPSQRLVILGVLVDTVAMSASLDADRLARMRSEISSILDRGTATRSKIEHVAGLCAFACQVIPLGRPFLRATWSAIPNLPYTSGRSRVPASVLKEFAWWLHLLAEWNGVRLLHANPSAVLDVWTDASGSVGAGGHLGPPGMPSAAFAYLFPSRHASKDILFKELHAVLHAADYLSRGAAWRGVFVTFHVDNQAAVAAINSGGVRHESAHALIRRLWLLAATRSFSFTAVWLPSAENGLADALSRRDWDRAKLICPQVLSLLPFSTPTA